MDGDSTLVAVVVAVSLWSSFGMTDVLGMLLLRGMVKYSNSYSTVEEEVVVVNEGVVVNDECE